MIIKIWGWIYDDDKYDEDEYLLPTVADITMVMLNISLARLSKDAEISWEDEYILLLNVVADITMSMVMLNIPLSKDAQISSPPLLGLI